MAVVIPKIIPGMLAIIIGQSRLIFKIPYNVQAVQFIVVIIGRTIDPGWPEMFSLIWSM